MAYVEPNFKTKKALRQALQAGEEVRIFSPGPFPVSNDKVQTIEGPHYPAPHSWYARVEIDRDCRVLKVIS